MRAGQGILPSPFHSSLLFPSHLCLRQIGSRTRQCSRPTGCMGSTSKLTTSQVHPTLLSLQMLKPTGPYGDTDKKSANHPRGCLSDRWEDGVAPLPSDRSIPMAVISGQLGEITAKNLFVTACLKGHQDWGQCHSALGSAAACDSSIPHERQL